MTSTAFSAFAADLEALVDDPHGVGERLGELLAQDGWLAPEHRRSSPDHYTQHLLHVTPDRRLSVVALVWLPGQRTPIHDHVSWCVVGVYEGRERELRYRAVEHGRERWLEQVGNVDALPGHVEVIVPFHEDIHAVTAAGPGPTISIHVYGADIEKLGSSIYRRFDDWEVREPAAAPSAPAHAAAAARSARRPRSRAARTSALRVATS
jgi:predicted metal-dependent enzyme (double-stranded beta helix superfamily)